MPMGTWRAEPWEQVLEATKRKPSPQPSQFIGDYKEHALVPGLEATTYMAPGVNYPPRHHVQLVSRKRVAVQSISSALISDHERSGLEEPITSDPHLEARIQLALRQAIASMGAPKPLVSKPSSVDGNAKKLEEMEAAHKAECISLAQARKEQEALRAKEDRLKEKKTQALQAELHAKLQEMAETEAAATLPFSERRERMARESMAVAKQPRLLQ
jgi:hypothetical protein